MLGYLGTIMSNLEIYVAGNIHFGMLCFAFLYLFTKIREDENSRLLVYYCIFFVIIISIPLTDRILVSFIDELSLIRIFWLVPAIILISYAMIQLQKTVKKPFGKFAFMCIILVFIWSNAGFHTSFSRAEYRGNPYNIPTSVIEVVDEIRKIATEHGVEKPTVLFPLSMMPYVRQYNATIILPFGGPDGRIPQNINMKNRNIMEIVDMYLEAEIDYQILIELLKAEEIDYFVVNEVDIEELEDSLEGLILIEESGGYNIFKVMHSAMTR